MKNIRTWNKWRKINAGSILHKIFVFFEIVHSPTFEIAERCGNEEDSKWY